MDTIVVDRNTLSGSENVSDRLRPLFMQLVQFGHPCDGIRRIIGIRFPPGRLDGRDLTGVVVHLGELLDWTAIDVVLICDVLRVELAIDNQLIDSGDIVSIQLHCVRMLEGEDNADEILPR